MTTDDVRRIAQTFFDPKQIALTILGNLEKFKIGREDLACYNLTGAPLVLDRTGALVKWGV